MKWMRAKDGAVFGVCKGIARGLELPVGWVRLFWALSIFFMGAGLGLYLLLAISLPREDKLAGALKPRVLGVCANIARRTDQEVGVIRFLAICLGLLSLGATIVGYVILYFVLEKPSGDYNSSNMPSTPPSTT